MAIAPDALETVVTNLLDNSLQHRAHRIDIHTSANGNNLQLRLHDDGEGISPANRDKIFTPFFTTKRTKGGTGLGLEIVTSIHKAYGGNIRLGNASQGAEFVLELPLFP